MQRITHQLRVKIVLSYGLKRLFGSLQKPLRKETQHCIWCTTECIYPTFHNGIACVKTVSTSLLLAKSRAVLPFYIGRNIIFETTLISFHVSLTLSLMATAWCSG